MTIFFSTYISSKLPEAPKPLIGIYEDFCNQTDPKPILCELPDDLGKNRSRLPQSLASTSITYSGTASGVSTSTIPLGMQYVVRGEK